MRALLLAGLFLATGAVMTTTTQDVTGQEKKDPPKKEPRPTDEKNFTEKVQVRRYFNGVLSTTWQKDVGAFKYEKGTDTIYVTKAKGGAEPTPMSHIIDAKGDIWVVEQVLTGSAGAGYYRSRVKLKPKG